jgi:Family of unknown function (DUF6263)
MKENKYKITPSPRLFFLGLLIFISLSSLFSQKKVNLLFKPSVGLEYLTEISSQSTILQEVMGIDQTMEMNIFMQLDSKVLSEDAGVFKIQYEYSSIKIASISPIFSIELSSNENTEKDENQLLKALTEKSFFVYIDQFGEISDVSGLDQIIASVSDDTNIDDNTKELFRDNLEATFGKEYFIQNMQQLFSIFPKKKIKIGDVWEYNSIVESSPAALNIRNKAKLIDISRNSVIIAINSDLETPDEGFKMIQGVPGKVELKGKQKIDLIVEKSSGFPTESKVSQDINGLILLKLQQEEGEDLMEIPMSIKTNLQIKVTLQDR